MRVCATCVWSETKPFQDHMGNIGSVMICKHIECRDVLVGEPLPALYARQQESYCGFSARYFKAKEENPVDNVISLVKK